MTSANPSPEADAQRRADVQYAVSRVLSEAVTVADAVHRLLPALAEALGWDYAAIWFPTATGDELICAAAWATADPGTQEFAAASRGWRFSPGQGLPGRVWQSGKAIWLSAIDRDETLPRVQLARAARLFGGLAFPITNREEVIGIVECFTRDTAAATPQLLHLTEAIGSQIGLFVQRRRAEERLEENEARYAAIVKGALDAIVAIDEDGLVVEFNPAAEKLFGYSRAEALGREMAELIIPSEFREAHRAGLRRHQASGQSTLLERRIELRACRRDGSEFPVELTISRMAVRGHWSFLGFLRDITERHASERERETLIAAERDAHDAAVAASGLKDEFLAALSHELRTPLNAILGWSAMLMKGVVDPDRIARVVATIHRNAQAQQRLVDDMLDMSAFVAGRVRMKREAMTVDEPVQAACEVVKLAADAKRVHLDVSVPPIPVYGDRLRLQQVFWNLFSNAVKFTPAGGSVTAQARLEGTMATVTITDTGRGIDPRFLPFVFDRFRQGREGREAGGLGLGLSIAKEIVEAHGGQVSAHSEGTGAGATFTVRIPTA